MPVMTINQLAVRMVDLLIERDGARDVARRLAACVADLEAQRVSRGWARPQPKATVAQAKPKPKPKPSKPGGKRSGVTHAKKPASKVA